MAKIAFPGFYSCWRLLHTKAFLGLDTVVQQLDDLERIPGKGVYLRFPDCREPSKRLHHRAIYAW
jgi:hypothetical protein